MIRITFIGYVHREKIGITFIGYAHSQKIGITFIGYASRLDLYVAQLFICNRNK
jgi:hypothetical protein